MQGRGCIQSRNDIFPSSVAISKSTPSGLLTNLILLLLTLKFHSIANCVKQSLRFHLARLPELHLSIRQGHWYQLIGIYLENFMVEVKTCEMPFWAIGRTIQTTLAHLYVSNATARPTDQALR